MNAPHSNAPRTTIVMTARDRHSLAEAAIDSVVSGTSGPFRFIYLDVQSPDWLREAFAARSTEWGLDVLRIDEPLWPQEARQRIIGLIDTEYVVFIDNDVLVEAGWLDALVTCADETGAGAVGPLYLWGDGLKPAKVQMAGGRLAEAATEGGRVLTASPMHVNAELRQIAQQIARAPCDYLDVRCMLIRMELLRDGSLLDVRIRCVHEQIDLALSVRKRGYAVFLEPAARVTSLAFADYMLDELPFFRSRWSAVEAENDIEAFCEKWNVLNDEHSFGSVRTFLRDHVARVDPLRAASRKCADLSIPMRRDELMQTRSGLLDVAADRGYASVELALIAKAYQIAHVLLDGGYRPCGRPFIAHLIGTASVLVRYSFRAELVAAGLLHATYTHGVPHADGFEAAIDAMCATLGGNGSAVERRVRAYTLNELNRTETSAGSDMLSTLSVLDAEISAIEAANELDMHLSGEFRYSGRIGIVRPRVMQRVARVSDVLGVAGLYDSLRHAQQQAIAEKSGVGTGLSSSYRIGPDRRSAVPMMVNARSTLARYL